MQRVRGRKRRGREGGKEKRREEGERKGEEKKNGDNTVDEKDIGRDRERNGVDGRIEE